MTPDKRELIELCEVVMDGTACGDPAFSLVDYEKAAKSVAHALKRILTEPQAGAVDAAKHMDWQQVILNGGPPCFHLEGDRFCGRAQRWAGHGDLHPFVSLPDLLQSRPASEGEGFVRVPVQTVRDAQRKLALIGQIYNGDKESRRLASELAAATKEGQ